MKLEGKFHLSKYVSRFQIELLEGHLYDDDFLTSDLLFIFYTIYTDIIILIDSATVAITIFQVRTKANELSLSIFSYYLHQKFVKTHFMWSN